MQIFTSRFRGNARLPVRPSFRDPRFAFLFAAYHFGASPQAISVTALCWPGPPMVLTAFAADAATYRTFGIVPIWSDWTGIASIAPGARQGCAARRDPVQTSAFQSP